MRTLLFIAYYMPPMGSSGVQRPLKLLRYLPQYGWNPIVLTPETGLYHTLDYSLLDELDQLKLQVHRVPSQTPFHRKGGSARLAPQIPDRLAQVLRWASAFRYIPDNKVGWIEPALTVADHILANQKPDVVFATSPPPSNLILASKIADKYGIPAVFDMRDDWVGNHQQIYPTSYHKRRMQKLEAQTLEKASAIVSVNEHITGELARRYPMHTQKLSTIFSGFDSADFQANAEPILKKPENKITLLYSGRFYGENQPDTFIYAMGQLIKKYPKWQHRFHLVFQGGLESRHHELIRSQNLESSYVDLGYLDHIVAIANLKVCDALWLTAAHKKRGEQVSTGKVFEYMAAQKPILALAPRGGAMMDILNGYGCVYQSDPYDIEGTTQLIHDLLSDIDRRTLPEIDEAFIQHYSSEKMAESFADVFSRVANRTILT